MQKKDNVSTITEPLYPIYQLFFLKVEEENKSSIPMPVTMWDFKHCDPKRCSGVKLARTDMLKTLKLSQRFRGIVAR